jgi:hypothetical protein
MEWQTSDNPHLIQKNQISVVRRKARMPRLIPTEVADDLQSRIQQYFTRSRNM